MRKGSKKEINEIMRPHFEKQMKLLIEKSVFATQYRDAIIKRLEEKRTLYAPSSLSGGTVYDRLSAQHKADIDELIDYVKSL